MPASASEEDHQPRIMLSTASYVLAAAVVLALAVIMGRRWANRLGARSLLRHRTRVDRFKLASRAHVREQLVIDPLIAAAVREHARETGMSEAAAVRRVHEYIDEIVPFFNV